MEIAKDLGHDVLVVIPTVADPAVLLPTVGRILHDARNEREREGGLRIALSLAVNSPDEAAKNRAIGEIERLASELRVDLVVWDGGRPIGFGAANNRGTAAALRRWGGLPDLVVYHNDDAHVPRGWIRRLVDAIRTTEVHGYSEPWDPQSGKRPARAVATYGRIGLVGPISNLVAGIQQVRTLRRPDGSSIEWSGDTDSFASQVEAYCPVERLTADFLSGFCIGLSREALGDLFLSRIPGRPGLLPSVGSDSATTWLDPEVPGEDWSPAGDSRERLVGPWDEDRYPIAGYEDNDLCVRAELAGWRAIVATDCFVGHVGHQTFDRLFPEQLRGMRNRIRYYRRWRSLTDPARTLNLAAAFRLRFEVGHDIHLFRLAVQRAAQLCDSIAVVLTANPLDVRDDARWPAELKMLQPRDVAMLEACSGQAPDGVAEVLRAWIEDQVRPVLGTRIGSLGIRVETWGGAFNERDERNRSAEIAEELGADWILSIDGDELVENRIERKHLERLMRFPDPLVRSYDSSWVNHWDAERLAREDAPWGDGGSWTGGMHGFRLWRVPRREDGSLAAPRRIMGGTEIGLHCGNSPDHDVTAKRVAGFRFRHFGYVRHFDRERKHARYKDQDPKANPILTGNGGADAYGHILAEQGMRLSPFVPLNGIGLAVLVHAKESPEDLARVLDQLSSICDRVVLVWTDAWDPALLEAVLEEAPPKVAAKIAERDVVRAAREEWIANNPGQAPPREPPRLRAARRVSTDLFEEAVPEPISGPSLEFLEIAQHFDAEWVHQPLEDDLGSARNAGLEALSSDADSLGWSLFWDLDEHFDGSPFAAAVTLRRMAEASDVHAWLFQFVNLHDDAEPSISESYRLARLLPGMRLRGRVHETFDSALERYAAAGADPRTRKAPLKILHLGLKASDEKMDAKLRRYHRWLLLELYDRPHNSAAWVSLALHHLQEGDEAKGLECLDRAVLCAGQGYLAYREAAMYHLRRGKVLLFEAIRRSRGSDWNRDNQEFAKILLQAVPDLPILGSARAGARVIPDVDLPPFVPPDNPGGLARGR